MAGTWDDLAAEIHVATGRSPADVWEAAALAPPRLAAEAQRAVHAAAVPPPVRLGVRPTHLIRWGPRLRAFAAVDLASGRPAWLAEGPGMWGSRREGHFRAEVGDAFDAHPEVAWPTFLRRGLGPVAAPCRDELFAHGAVPSGGGRVPAGQFLAAVARHIEAVGPLAELTETWRESPPAHRATARRTLAQALAAALATERHELARRWVSGRIGRDRAELSGLVARLGQAAPSPAVPAGVNAAWVKGTLVFEGAPVWSASSGIGDPPAARRLLRAIGARSEASALTSWLRSALAVRTLGLLLGRAA